jgi:succinate dehydrogenase hydrophobic anchor subunit
VNPAKFNGGSSVKISKSWSMVALVLVSSVMAHAGVRVPVVLADIIVPEPNTAMFGAGLLLVGLAVARLRQKK